MNKQKNIDIAHEESFDYGLISIMVFLILLSAIQVNMIFFLLKNWYLLSAYLFSNKYQ